MIKLTQIVSFHLTIRLCEIIQKNEHLRKFKHDQFKNNENQNNIQP
jgi:hypothetical protein